MTRMDFANRHAFWLGTLAIAAGVSLHLPALFASPDHMLAHMGFSPDMALGMALIAGGLACAAYGLIPRRAQEPHHTPAVTVDVRTMDTGPLNRAHWALVGALFTALVVDVMKPATLGFVLPGVRAEYGLTVAQSSALPLVALTGTTIGSLLWGHMADRIGRRPSILLAALGFVATSICGAMPGFVYNLAMCFLMGMTAGGLLPIVYALLAESVPADQRGWMTVLFGGLGTVGGYLAAAGAAHVLIPHFGWRIMWFLGLPTGVLLIALNSWINESPRFLVERGRHEEARQVMARFGVTVSTTTPVAGRATPNAARADLLRRPYRAQTVAVVLYGLGWGLVNWGFVTLLPTILSDGMGGDAAGILFLAALIAIPGTVVVAALYSRWSSKYTMLLYAGATVTALLGFAVLDPRGGGEGSLSVLIVLLLVSSGGIIATLVPYATEVYPTRLRGVATGLAAGSSKVGGVVGPPIVAGVLSLWPGFTGPALAVAVPVALSALVLAVTGLETKGRPLDDAEPTGPRQLFITAPAKARVR